MRLRTPSGAQHLIRSTVCWIVIGIVGTVATLPLTRSAVADDAQLLARCPTVGDASLPKVQALNTLKRRMTTPTPADIDRNATLKAMVAPGHDTTRWDERHGATIEGYVAGVKVGGVESVNCHTHDPAYRDTHIELTLDPMRNDESTYVIVEVTPQVREEMSKKGVDWGTNTLRTSLLGHWVRITGWLLYDVEHEPNAKNTASGGARIWRATVWEIHPITAIEVLPGKPQ